MMPQPPMPFGEDAPMISAPQPVSGPATVAAPAPVSSPTAASPSNTSRNKKEAIDYSKFKTKLCRHFLMGLPCPFEDRCAFAHGEDQLNERSGSSGASTGGDSADDEQALGLTGTTTSPLDVSDSSVNVAGPYSTPSSMIPAPKSMNALPPPPPSYGEFVTSASEVEFVDSPYDSRPTTPPSYPSRFRYEPYSTSGIVFQA